MNQVAARAGVFSALKWCPPVVMWLLIALTVPNDLSFSIGSLRLTPYRVVLIGAFLPSLMALWSGRAGRMIAADLLLLLHVLWGFVVLSYHHGAAIAAESGGIRMLELYGSYLVARTAIVDERTFRGAMAMVFLVVCLLAPIVFLESITGFHAIKVIAAKLSGFPFSAIDARYGFHRAYGPFDHPILLGVFAASVLAVTRRPALPRLGHPRARSMPWVASMVAALSSMSSGALAALSVQMGLLWWDQKTRALPRRWAILSALIVLAYVAVDVMSNRSGYQVFLSYMTFSAGTAYNRLIIFEWGIQDVWRNPVFGIGFNTWTRPEWMHSTSMDNFWLVQAVTFGLPGFFSVALAVWFTLRRGWEGFPPRLTRLRLGWTISMIGIIVAATTVHLWNNIFVYFFFLLGAGTWFVRVRRTQGALAEEPAYA